MKFKLVEFSDIVLTFQFERLPFEEVTRRGSHLTLLEQRLVPRRPRHRSQDRVLPQPGALAVPARWLPPTLRSRRPSGAGCRCTDDRQAAARQNLAALVHIGSGEADDDRHIVQLGPLRRAPPAFTSNNLI